MQTNVNCNGCGHIIPIMFRVQLCNRCLDELQSPDALPWAYNSSIPSKRPDIRMARRAAGRMPTLEPTVDLTKGYGKDYTFGKGWLD